MNQIEQFVIKNQCLNLVLDAAAYADGHEADKFSRLFAPDATLVRPGDAPLIGRAAIRHAYSQRPTDRITRHLVTNTRVCIDTTTTAHARSYVLLWTGSTQVDAGPHGRAADARELVGEFDDWFSLHQDGEWLINRREARFVLFRG